MVTINVGAKTYAILVQLKAARRAKGQQATYDTILTEALAIDDS